MWNTFHSYERALGAVEEILSELKLSYLDLCLIHWPMGYQEGGELFPKNGEKMLYSDVDYLETWRALEQKVKEGKIRSIGLSNFSKEQVERVASSGTVKPSALQVDDCFCGKNANAVFRSNFTRTTNRRTCKSSVPNRESY